MSEKINSIYEKFQKTLNDKSTVSADFYSNMRYVERAFKNGDITEERYNEIKNLWNSVKSVEKTIKGSVIEIDECYVDRDENDFITKYCFKIYRKGKEPLEGHLNRADMEKIYALYSTSGCNLSRKSIHRDFPQFDFEDFKKVLRVFNILKSASPWPQHLLEELDS